MALITASATARVKSITESLTVGVASGDHSRYLDIGEDLLATLEVVEARLGLDSGPPSGDRTELSPRGVLESWSGPANKGEWAVYLGPKTRMWANEKTTVRDVKDFLEVIGAYAHHRAKVTFGGKQLEDDRTLSSYGIQRDSTLRVTSGLGGGAKKGSTGSGKFCSDYERSGSCKAGASCKLLHHHTDEVTRSE